MGKALPHPESPHYSCYINNEGITERGGMPGSRALDCGSVNLCTPLLPFIQTRPFGVNNSSTAPKPVLICCTHSSAESCLDFSWGQDRAVQRSTRPPPPPRPPQVCSGGDSTGSGVGGGQRWPRPFSSPVLLCCLNFFCF